MQKYVKEEEHTWMIPEGPFKEADPVIRLYSVMELLKTAAGCAKDLGLVHAEQVENLLTFRPGGRCLFLMDWKPEKYTAGSASRQ